MAKFEISGGVSLMFKVEVEADSFKKAEKKAIDRIKDYYHLDSTGGHHASPYVNLCVYDILKRCSNEDCHNGYSRHGFKVERNNGICDECASLKTSNPND